MTTTHTPGPWRVTGPNIRAGDALVAVAENLWADMVCSEEEKTANARLIAAAPDLLAAAIDALETFERRFPDSPTAHDLRAAIAKATGA